MTLRSPRERAFQTLAFEAGGLVLVAPCYALMFGSTVNESLILLLALSAAAMIWSPLHNWAFDLAEWRLAQRPASDRPQGLRALHALSLEGSALVVTLPLVMWLTGLDLAQALLVEAGLTLAYVVWAWAFHLAWDNWRPVVVALPA